MWWGQHWQDLSHHVAAAAEHPGQRAAQALFGHLPKCDAIPLCLRAAVLQEKRWTRERLQEPMDAFERLVAELEDMKGRPGLLAPTPRGTCLIPWPSWA